MKNKLRHVKLASIKVDQRFREDLGDIESLQESIAEKGVLQPITISSNMELLAGGRRYTACKALGLEEIPALIREDVDEIDAREIELLENVQRKDFTWQEQAKLTAHIYNLYQQKDPKWSVRKTAQLIDRGVMPVLRSLELAKALNENPDIAECGTMKEAFSFLRLKEEQEVVEELARRVQQRLEAPVKGPGPQEREETALLLACDRDYKIMDIFQGLASLKTDGKYDLIECDPPYGIGFGEKFAERYGNPKADKTAKQISSFIDVPERDYPAFMQKLCSELYRVAGKNCWMTMWFNMQWYAPLLQWIEDAGWKVDITPAVWVKTNRSESGVKNVFGRSYEPFLLCRKGDPVMAHVRHNTFIEQLDETKYHPTQKPLALMKDLLSSLILPGSHVLVPFAGSGTTMRACYLLGNFPLGFDLNGEYKDRYMLEVREDYEKMKVRESLQGEGNAPKS